jgi:hypothetical protein
MTVVNHNKNTSIQDDRHMYSIQEKTYREQTVFASVNEFCNTFKIGKALKSAGASKVYDHNDHKYKCGFYSLFLCHVQDVALEQTLRNPRRLRSVRQSVLLSVGNREDTRDRLQYGRTTEKHAEDPLFVPQPNANAQANIHIRKETPG